MQAVRDLYFKLARDSFGTVNYDIYNNLKVQSMSIYSASTFADTKKWLDSIMATGGTAILYVHDLVDTPVSMQTSAVLFSQIVDYVSDALSNDKCDVPTLTEWHNAMYSM